MKLEASLALAFGMAVAGTAVGAAAVALSFILALAALH